MIASADPGPDEIVVENSQFAVECKARFAEDLGSLGYEIGREIMTAKSDQSLIYRADAFLPDHPNEITRYVCARHGDEVVIQINMNASSFRALGSSN